MKNKYIIKLAILLLFIVSSFGCSSLFNSGKQTVKVQTPEGENIKAKLITAEETVDITLPSQLVVKSTNYDVYLKIVDDCYKPNTTKLPSKVSPIVFANLFWVTVLYPVAAFTGAVDLAFGKTKKYEATVSIEPEKLEDCNQNI
jgi:hypothetical protein